MLTLLFKLLDGGTPPEPPVATDTHDGWWAKQWKKAKQRETQTVRIEEIEEQIAEIQERLEAVEPVPAKPAAAVYQSQEPDYSERLRIIDLLIAHRERLIEQEDEELLLLL